MTRLQERPRVSVALAAAAVLLVIASMLAGGAIAGGNTSSASGAHQRAELAGARRQAATATRQLSALRRDLRDAGTKQQAAENLARRWAARARRAERRNRTHEPRRGGRRARR